MTPDRLPEPPRAAARPGRSAALAVVAVLLAGVIGVVALPSRVASSTTAGVSGTAPVAPQADDGRRDPPPRTDREDDDDGRALGEAGGAVADGVTVDDDSVPAVANLDPDLLDALRSAAADAADRGITLYVNSGWRSPAYQEQLLREAVARYGSEERAARWVATADTSPHVSGDAVDIGHPDAAAWLSEHGSGYGLCRVYRNEPWHFELRPDAVDDGCPRLYADPTHDPRMR